MASLKEFESEDGLKVWLCQDGTIGFGVGYDSSELSWKEALKLIAYLTRILGKGLNK